MNISTFRSFFRSYGLFFSITIGCFCPFLHSFAEDFFSWLLMPMLFLAFIRIRAPLRALHWSHALLVLWNLLFPCAAYWTMKALGFSENLAMVAFFCGITPTGTAAPVVMTFLEGKMEYVLLAFLLSTLAFTFGIPILFPIFYGIETPGLSLLMLKKVCGVVLLPMVLALVCRMVYPKSETWGHRAQDFSFLLWQCLIILVCAQMSHGIQSNSGLLYAIPQMFLTALSICTLNFAAGHVLGFPNYRRECSQALGQKNLALSLLVAVLYANPAIVLGTSLYIVCHNSWNAIQIAHHQRAKRKREAEREN